MPGHIGCGIRLNRLSEIGLCIQKFPPVIGLFAKPDHFPATGFIGHNGRGVFGTGGLR